MGEVYRARDRKLDREVALKVLPPDLVSSSEHLRRFEQEARAASALNHPNIITIYEIGRSDSMAYIAMELVEGRDLREMMEDPVPIRQAVRIACKVADGLAAAHERGIVHRDLKPENLMISRDGFVKILDFGLAKLIRPVTQSDETAPHTTPGSVFGTVGYMSPEQAAGRAIDFRSDQFALGVILYEILARRRPFDRGSAPETMTAIIREDAPPITRGEGVPPELQRVLDRCLAKDPSERYASTRDLARDLREVRDRLTPTQSGRRSGGYGLPAPRSFVPVAAGLIVVALIAATAFLMNRRGAEVPDVSPPVRMQSLAVLPFRNLSGTEEGQMFTDGVAATITGRLAQSRAVKVSAPFEGGAVPANADLRDIARRRGADLILQGEVQRAQDKVRVSFAVIDPSTGTQVGGDSITGSTADVFALEDRVAESVLQTLRVPFERSARDAWSGIEGAGDQQAYIEAVGFLQRPRNEKAIDEAISRLQKLLANSRDSAAVNTWLGRALCFKSQLSRRPGLMEEATVFAERAVESAPDHADTQVTLGMVRINSGRHAEAVTAFQTALKLQPNSTEAILGLGDTYAAMGRGSDAEDLYRKAIELNPDLPGAHNRYGYFCYSRGRYAEAVDHYRKYTELVPDNPSAFTNLGAAYHFLGRYADALQAYEQALKIVATAATYSNVGSVRYALGRFDDAVVMFEKATELAPNYYLVFANLGDARRWSNNHRDRAADAYNRAIRLAAEAINANPKDALVHAVVASSHAKLKQPSEAARAISTALKLDPTDKDVLYQAAVVSHLRQNDDAALTWLERSIEAGYSPTDAQRDPELMSLHQHPTFQRVVSISGKKS
jgi:serine/threonine-protein kinase